MKIRIKLFTFILLLATSQAQATSTVQYEIGGAEPVSDSIYYRHDASVGAGFYVKGRFSCGQFDFDASVKNMLSDARNRLRTEFVSAIQSALSALPAIILQRVNPGLYDLFQNLMVRAEGDVRFASASCRQLEQAAMSSDDPFGTLLRNSVEFQWSAEAEANTMDITSASDNVDENPGAEGIPYCDGSTRGGDGDTPIHPTFDVTLIGYNTLAESNHCLRETEPTKPVPNLTNVFPNAGIAAKWTQAVFGDVKIITTDESTKETIPGRGLHKEVQSEKDKARMTLTHFVASISSELPDSLRQFFAYPGSSFNNHAFKTLAEKPETEREIYISRIATEMAISRSVDKALTARRLLIAGQQVPMVENASGLKDYSNQTIARIDREIDDLMYEKRIREELVSNSTMNLLQKEADARAAGSALPNVPEVKTIIKDGDFIQADEDQ